MLVLKSEVLNLRGVADKVGKTGNVYYIVNVESSDGTPHQLYCPDASAFAPELKRNDDVFVTFDVHYYKGQERLVVKSVEHA